MRRSAPILAAVLFGCGPGIPTHDGYGSARQKPWEDAKQLQLDKLGEAEVDDTVSYPRQQRARWYAVDLPSPGELKVELFYAPLLLGQREQRLDLAFEVLNGDFEVITRADAEEPDAGDEEKSRTLYELPQGRYYVHVFAQDRLDEAEFTLRLAFAGGEGGGSSDFPAEVAYIGQLAAVPPVDDAPAPRPERRRKRRRPRKEKPEKEEKGEKASEMRARISGITASGGATRIRINRGENAGVEVGWRGKVVNSAGSPIPGGSFTVSKVTRGEAYAKVKATADAVTAAKYVRLRPP